MRFEIVEIEELSGDACKIYSIIEDGSADTLFDEFLEEMDVDHSSDVDTLWDKLRFIGKEGGARIQFFRENEGKPGDGVVALLNASRFPLRLYCIRFGSVLLILGGGGYKDRSIRAWQDDEKLRKAAIRMEQISSVITVRIRNREILIGPDGSLSGDLVFEDQDIEI